MLVFPHWTHCCENGLCVYAAIYEPIKLLLCSFITAIAIRIFRPKNTCTQQYENYNACGSACPKTCDNYNTTVACTDQCVPGCYCTADYVRNSDGTCCKPEECPGILSINL